MRVSAAKPVTSQRLWRSALSAARLAWALWLFGMLATALELVLRLENTSALAASVSGPQWLEELLYWGILVPAAGPAYATVGALVAARRPRNAIGWLSLALGLLVGIQDLTWQYAARALEIAPGSLPYGLAAGWLAGLLNYVVFPLPLTLLLLLFPTGRLHSWRDRLVAAFGVAGMLLGLLARVADPLVYIGLKTSLPNPTALPLLAPFVELAFAVGMPVMLLTLLLAFVAVVLRWRRAQGDERRQLAWIGYIGMLAAVSGALAIIWGYAETTPSYVPVVIGAIALAAITVGVPVAIGVAVLKYNLYTIDNLIQRTLVYAALSASAIGIYVVLVGGLNVLFQAQSSPLVALVATAVVAVAFQPLRERFQRGVDRLIYGDRDNPYTAVSRLGRRLEATLAPDAVLPAIVQTLAESFKLSYAAILLDNDGHVWTASAIGTPRTNMLWLPLSYQGETIGQLVLGPRPGEDAFSPEDRRLLADLARQAGAAAHAVRLTADLQRARERLVNAREEERRRIRRDLHDGLGPQLASQSLMIETARHLLHSDPATADALLGNLKSHTKTAIDDIRRLVYALRPPALDEFGLVGALRDYASRYDSGELRITIEAPDNLPTLPAAVEVAAFRIAQEALTNVVRHANAHQSVVRLTLAGGLQLEISDDGKGMADGARAGVGLTSIRERAAELGGSCTISSNWYGTRVVAHLPLAEGTTMEAAVG